MRFVRCMALVVLVSAMLPGCSSYPHHGMGNHGKGDRYWEKAGTDLSTLVEKTVTDPEKAKRVNTVMGEIIGEIKQSSERSRQFHRKLYELNANYDAAPEDFTKIFDELNTHRMRSAAKILGLRYRMKEQMTAQEWKALSDAMMSSYGSRYDGKNAEAGARAGS